MSTKHIFDSSDGLVLQSLRGAVALNPSLRLHAGSKTVYLAQPAPTLRTAVLSGGGAGHEPAHASYTGHGMLASSVSGEIFASPSAKQILAAIEFAAFSRSSPSDSNNSSNDRLLSSHNVQGADRDVLIIINNYTGDRLNFGLAIEKALSLYPSLSISSVVVADDVSLLPNPSAEVQPEPSLVGPRGLGGNILVCKILGAFAARGSPLSQVKVLGDAVVANLASIGVGLDHCHVPGRRLPHEQNSDGEKGNNDGRLKDGECEIGLGLHNEPGVKRMKYKCAKDIIQEMLNLIMISRDHLHESEVQDSARTSSFIRRCKQSGELDDIVLFINNLGGMSQLEMGAIVDEVVIFLENSGIHPLRIYSSSYMTSLNAPGFSISLLNVSRVEEIFVKSQDRGECAADVKSDGIHVVDLLDAPTDAHSWLGIRSFWPPSRVPFSQRVGEKVSEQFTDRLSSPNPHKNKLEAGGESSYWRTLDISETSIRNAIISACDNVLTNEGDMTKFDTVVGDGDCGETFAKGAKSVLSAIHSGQIDISQVGPSALIAKVGDILETNMGGTIGALFALFFTAWSNAYRQPRDGDSRHSQQEGYGLPYALRSLSSYTPARPGDRTIIDALQPLCSSLSSGATFSDAVKEARKGAESTRGMKARLGRATYVGNNSPDVEEGGNDSLPPDPGAWGIVAIAEGFWEGFSARGRE